MFYALIWLNIFYLAYQDHVTAKKDEDHIGYVSLWACVSLGLIAFFTQYENIQNALLFLFFWIFNTYLISIIEKRNPFDIFGAGDYFLLFAIGFFINNPIDFIVFILVTAISSFVYVKIRKTSYFPFVPSIMIGFLFEEILPVFFKYPVFF